MSLSGRGCLKQPLRTFRIARFSQVVNEWNTLGPLDRQQLAPAALDAIQALVAEMDPEDPDQNRLFNLERTLVVALDEDHLRRQLWYWRNEYKRFAPEATFAAYLQSAPPDPATASRSMLVADLQSLMGFLHDGLAL